MGRQFSDIARTCYCGQVRANHVGQTIVLKGWANYRRDHGGLVFVDLRDRTGLAQIVFDPENLPEGDFEQAHRLRTEDVLAIEGVVRDRPEDKINANLETGKWEILVTSFEVLAKSEPVPFRVDEYSRVTEDQRLRYRYLDLRRPEMQAIIQARARFFGIVRRYLDAQGLLEVDTPMLTRSTPEGARDFLVPSRMNPGTFYALPQSPQLFKQILMVAGIDGYYQIARCFRDEDLRANRQPEFTQIDIELSFIDREDIYRLIEGMICDIFKQMKGIEFERPFRRMTHAEAMLRYGSDKPDLRFGLEIADVSDVFKEGCSFKVFTDALGKGGVARAMCVPGGGEKYSNTQLKPGGELPEHAARYGAKGLAWFRAEKADGGVTLASSISKFFEPACLARLMESVGAKEGDLILIVVDKPLVAANAMGQMRLRIARDMNLIDDSKFELTWVTDFPLLEYDETEKRFMAMHHPFTSPHPDDLEFLETDPGRVRSLAYDLALNGEEIGGGSIRIHRSDMQKRMFRALGINEEEAQARFGFLLEALSFGAPPHGGIAFGVDRMMMILMGRDSIRDVIPFPKTQSGACLMTDAPSTVDAAQLRELGLRLDPRITGGAKPEAPPQAGQLSEAKA